MSTALRKAYRDLTKRKVRSLLTIVGIVIGVAGVVTIISTSRSMTLGQQRAYANSSQADIVISTREAPDNLRPRLLDVPNVAEAELRSIWRTKWAAGDGWLDILFVGVTDFGEIRVNKIDLKQGSFPSKGEVTLEYSALDVNPVSIGDEIGYRTRRGESFREQHIGVVGFARSPAYPSAMVMNTSVGYATAEDVRRMMGTEGNNQVLVKLEDFRERDDTITKIRDLMAKRSLPVLSQTVRDPDNYPGKRELDSLMLLMLIFSAVGLITSGFLVANTLSAIIGEQVVEIGAMKAFGATREQVLVVYLLLAVMYGVVGTVGGLATGIAGGWALQQYLAKLMNIDIWFELDALAIAVGCGVGMGATVISAMVPAWFGTSISVKAAMDTYGVSTTYGQSNLDRLLSRLTRVSPLFAFSIRNLARRKLRSVVTVGVIALASAAFMAAWSTDASVQMTIDKLYVTYGIDGSIWFDESVGQGFGRSITGAEGVVEVEPWLTANGTMKGTSIRMRGFPHDTVLYDKIVLDGRWFEEGERDALVVSSEVARRLNVRIGDVLEVETSVKSQTFRVVGSVKDSSTSAGSTTVGNVFLPVDVLSNLLGRKGLANFFALKFDDSDAAYVDRVLATLEKRYRGLTPGTFSIYADRENNRKLTSILSAMLYGMVIIVASIGVMGVLNTLTLNVLERRREIGIMRSIGATDGKLIQVFLIEGLALGVIGSAFGMAIGFPLSRHIVGVLSSVLFELDFYFEPLSVASMVLFTILLSGLASLGPALGAASMSTNQALRYE